MSTPTIDDNALLELLFEIFRRHGYEGTTISQLSEATGLKKSSLYHRFPEGKDDMVKAVVLYISRQLHQHVIEPLSDVEKKPEIRFGEMIATLKALYHDGKKNCLLNVLTLGNAKDEIKALLHQDYSDWIAALTQLGQDAGMSRQHAASRSEHFLMVVQGALVIQRLTADALTLENCMKYEQEQFFKPCES